MDLFVAIMLTILFIFLGIFLYACCVIAAITDEKDRQHERDDD